MRDDTYGPCEDCAASLMRGVIFPLDIGNPDERSARVIACDCGEYASDEEAAADLVGVLGERGRNYEVCATETGVFLRDLDAGGALLTMERALDVLAEVDAERTSLVETGPSSSSTSRSSSSSASS